MADADVGPCPQVFVVDTYSNCDSVPGEKKPMRARAGIQFLLLLLGLVMLGLVVQGVFIYTLYKKTEVLSHERSHPYFLNLSNPKSSEQQDGTIMGQVGSKELNEIPIQQPHLEEVQQRPFAHLMGSNNPGGDNNVVQWTHDSGDAITHNMSYDKGRLLVEREGYYYLYSKVQLNAVLECSLIQHKVMKDTSAYGHSILLMRSKSLRCRTPKPESAKTSNGEYLWNSFLAGIFHLQRGDQIFVTLENMQKIRPGSTDNFMGAFMILP
ncbi:tumor necrosis factor ligand superfamily member 14-like [Paralichthys olivaceus]|uniref:tumor necrosis factor ligand superfamily member 14-like n=1 Tax=Paralichthys olivaceus TaxID=8255 RepID=UPI00097D4390|nr:PREDICTED: tumor necrosis factor ligand superfamily member 14-like [Paralichthys olivaceus]XP_019939946.1 PREDICTED: tumor necrosis factor ligand superfamily member 14-like [Paralichthys olivaceus]XP_019939947.1 PREDICTED: tumor necrosis factor ligand superfamily member 14-like [Paralichthys olivaceus]